MLVGCGVVEWGPAFDEPAMIAVGCEEIGNQKEQQQSLIQLYRLEGDSSKGSFVQYGQDLFMGHSGQINDLSWAPLYGRSFHLLVSVGSDN